VCRRCGGGIVEQVRQSDQLGVGADVADAVAVVGARPGGGITEQRQATVGQPDVRCARGTVPNFGRV
jgi:hypothetical protein